MDELVQMLVKAGKTEEEAKSIIAKAVGSGSGNEQELREAKATAARILEEKKALKAKLDTLTSEVEELKSHGMSDGEKLKQQLERTQALLKDTQTKLTEVEKVSSTEKRSNELAKIRTAVKFLDTVPVETAALIVSDAFNGVDDLRDQETVNAIVAKLKQTHQHFIKAESNASGSGVGGGSGTGSGASGGTVKLDPAAIMKMDDKEFLANAGKLAAQASQEASGGLVPNQGAGPIRL